jgi:DNA polymerase III alpha subunit (gram-positive type)
MMGGGGGLDDLSARSAPANNVHQLRADKEKFEKVMKITDDLISQAKLTENKYNSNANNWHFVSEAWELCVNYCEKEFDHSVDRFKNDWNRKLTYVIKEKHRWNDKMKRMKEYDSISHYSSSPSPAAPSSSQISEIEREKERRIQQQQALSSSRTPTHSNSAYIPSPNESRSFGTSSPNISMYSVNSTSNHQMKSKSGSTLYDNHSSSRPMMTSPSSPPPSSSVVSSGPYSGPEPNKLEKLQDKLQRNKVKSIVEKALLVTNSAKYELSKKAVQEAKQAWNDAVSLYEQSYNNAPPAFRDWWREEVINIKRLRDENVAFLIDKMPNNTSMYQIDVAGSSSMSPNNGGRVQFNEPGLPVPNLASISSHSSHGDERGINVVQDKDFNMSMDMSHLTSSSNQRSPQPVSSASTASTSLNNSSNRGNSVNFHRVRVG